MLLLLNSCGGMDYRSTAPFVEQGAIRVQVRADGVGVSGVRFILFDTAPIDTVVTDGFGRGTFRGLSDGTYTVILLGSQAIQPPGDVQTVTVAGPFGSKVTFFLTGGWWGETPPNDTPTHTVMRFRDAYTYQVSHVCAELLTRDFEFHFSPQADPDLVARFGTTWGKSREGVASGNLFNGFTNSLGEYLGGVSRIELSLIGIVDGVDPEHVDSSAFYRRVRILYASGQFEEIEPDSISTLTINAPQDFYVVRGDVAVLDPDQDPAANRWYIRRWDDLAPAIPTPASLIQAGQEETIQTTTWGRIKARYLD